MKWKYDRVSLLSWCRRESLAGQTCPSLLLWSSFVSKASPEQILSLYNRVIQTLLGNWDFMEQILICVCFSLTWHSLWNSHYILKKLQILGIFGLWTWTPPPNYDFMLKIFTFCIIICQVCLAIQLYNFLQM